MLVVSQPQKFSNTMPAALARVEPAEARVPSPGVLGELPGVGGQSATSPGTQDTASPNEWSPESSSTLCAERVTPTVTTLPDYLLRKASKPGGDELPLLTANPSRCVCCLIL